MTGWLEIADDVSEWLESTTTSSNNPPILDLSLQKSIFNRR